MRAEVVRPHLNSGPRISAIPIASTAGLLDVGVYREMLTVMSSWILFMTTWLLMSVPLTGSIRARSL